MFLTIESECTGADRLLVIENGGRVESFLLVFVVHAKLGADFTGVDWVFLHPIRLHIPLCCVLKDLFVQHRVIKVVINRPNFLIFQKG